MPGKPFTRSTLVLCLFSCCWPAVAQVVADTSTGAIAGKVVDPQDVGIFRVEVVVTEESAVRTYRTATDCDGLYRVSDLPPGSYSVQFAAKGFRNDTRSTIRVIALQTTQVNDRLLLGAFSSPPLDADSIQGDPIKMVKPIATSVPTGEITGRVTDIDGKPLSATIIVTEELTEESHSAKTNSQGIYRLQSLSAGKYCVGVQTGTEFETSGSVLVTGANVTVKDVSVRNEKKAAESAPQPPK